MELLKFLLVLIPLMLVSAFIRTTWPKWGSLVMYLLYLGSALFTFFYVPPQLILVPLFIGFVSLFLLYGWYKRFYKRS